jgi:hypothetical protein
LSDKSSFFQKNKHVQQGAHNNALDRQADRHGHETDDKIFTHNIPPMQAFGRNENSV